MSRQFENESDYFSRVGVAGSFTALCILISCGYHIWWLDKPLLWAGELIMRFFSSCDFARACYVANYNG